jgi:ankyrin repeat protein
MNELIELCKSGEMEKAEALIKSGADVNQQDEQGWTPLNFAAGKGDLAMVKLLVESGADIFKVGRDNRTPYMIALAAGRAEVARYLRDKEDAYPGEKPPRPERKYCKAYYLKDLRSFSDWSEERANWKTANENNDQKSAEELIDDSIVFIHQDFTVTRSMWHNENVVFNNVTPEWKTFCSDKLGFKVPDDLDLIVQTTSAT